MAEDEVSYASVVFKVKKRAEDAGSHRELESFNPKHAEETVYDEVKVQSKASEPEPESEPDPDPDPDPGPGPEQTPDVNKKESSSRLLLCLLVLTLVLLVTVIGLCVYVFVVRDLTVREMNQLREKQETLLADNDNLKQNNTGMVEQLDRLNSNITHLENQNKVLENQTQFLETEKKNLTDQILNWNKLNVSRAQWSIDAYCPRNICTYCQDGWEFTEPRCYAINNAEPRDMKSWEDAQKDCLGKMSDLAVVHTEEEKKTINGYSWDRPNGSRYWIGLRVVDGKWKWIDGTDLTNSRWIASPIDGHCAVSVKSEGWKSVKCDTSNRWICVKDALSLK